MGESWRETVRNLAVRQAQVEMDAYWAQYDARPFAYNYRLEHVQAVVKTAIRLAEMLGGDLEVVEAAAWLHDIYKGEKQHGILAAEAVPNILGATDFPQEKIPRVADAIRKHVGLFKEQRLEPLEAAILWDADKLTKVGLQGMFHTLSGLPPSSSNEEEFLAKEVTRLEALLPKIVASFNTPLARQLGEERLQQLEATLTQLRREHEVSLPGA